MCKNVGYRTLSSLCSETDQLIFHHVQSDITDIGRSCNVIDVIEYSKLNNDVSSSSSLYWRLSKIKSSLIQIYIFNDIT